MIDILIVTILAILATYRLSRLISRDVILNGIRKEINIKAAEPDSGWYFVAELINCPHCVGVWIAFFMIIILSLILHWVFWLGMLVFLSVAGGQSFLQSLVETDEE